MSALNRFMSRGPVPPQVHGVLDYPLAAILIAGAPRARLRLHGGDDHRPRVRGRRCCPRRGHGVADRDREDHPATPSRLRGYARDGGTDRAAVRGRLLIPDAGPPVLRHRRRTRSARHPCDTLRVAGAVRAADDGPEGCVAGARARPEQPRSRSLRAGRPGRRARRRPLQMSSRRPAGRWPARATQVRSVTDGPREPVSCIGRRIACPGPAR